MFGQVSQLAVLTVRCLSLRLSHKLQFFVIFSRLGDRGDDFPEVLCVQEQRAMSRCGFSQEVRSFEVVKRWPHHLSLASDGLIVIRESSLSLGLCVDVSRDLKNIYVV